MDGVPAGRDWHADRGHAHWRQPALVTGCHSVPGPTSRGSLPILRFKTCHAHK